jgi:hypothetical protein
MKFLTLPPSCQRKEGQRMAEWISVKERLPEEYEACLIWYEYYHYSREKVLPEYGIGFYAPQIEAWCGDPSTGRDVKVLYWMPLPEPPKERVSNDAKEKSEEQAGDAG